MSSTLRSALLAAALLSVVSGPALADKIANRVAVFEGLDKITGRIITFDVYIDETVSFGTLRVTPRVCYSRPSTEAAQTDAFVEVDDVELDGDRKRIFEGWMFAASPGLNAIEHPIYDVWLTDCRMDSDVPPPSARNGGPRVAQAHQDAAHAGGADGGPTLQIRIVNGIPLPPVKPPVPAIGAMPDDSDTSAPAGPVLD